MQNEKIVVKIRIQDGEFQDCNGAEPRILSKHLVMVNGWECVFYPNGALKCSIFLNNRYSKDDMAILKISPKGYYSFIIHENGQDCCLKSFTLDKWPDNGSLILITRSTGKVNASFQDDKYEAFLKRHGITAIKRRLPNGIYRIKEYFGKDENKRHSYTTIHSDGEIIRCFEGTLKLETYHYIQNFYDVEVKNATWVLITIYDNTHVEPLTTLYSKVRWENIANLPEKI